MTTQPIENFTFSKLLALLPAWFERTDSAFAQQIPNFVALAESQLATDMKTQGFLSVVRGALPLSPIMQKPTFWRETVAFNYVNTVGMRVPLMLRSLEYAQAFWPNTNLKAAPSYYCDYNINNFWLAATPDANYPYELSYMARLQPLGPNNDSNWMTLNAPTALFYGIAVQAAVFTQRPDMGANYMQMYQAAVQGMLQENAERLTDRTEVVTRA